MNKHGERYYEIYLFRGKGPVSRETFVLGVGLNGQVVSSRYDGRVIRQWDGLDAEAMAKQMVEESDPPWNRGGDHIPS